MEQNFQDNEYRVILFGGGSVGKSSLVWRFLCNTFKETYTATIEDTYTHVSDFRFYSFSFFSILTELLQSEFCLFLLI